MAVQRISAEQLVDRLTTSRWIPIMAAIAAFALLAYSLAQWTWRLLDSPTKESAAETTKPQTANVSQATAVDVQPLLNAQIFGRAATTTSVDPNQLPISALNIVLTGVMARGNSSFAFLSINGAPEIFLTIGQEVTAGATLEAVHSDRVVLRRGATLESVLIKGSDVTLAPGSITGADGAIRPMGNGVFGVNRQALSQAITPRTMQQASVVPTPDGLVMQQIDPGSIFERLGLSPGDTVRHINGRPVTNLQEAMSVYAEITNSAESEDISVEISRGGRTEVLTYQVPSQSQP
jgi:general secretion pathway protein C